MVLHINNKPGEEIIEIEGVKYSYQLFKTWAKDGFPKRNYIGKCRGIKIYTDSNLKPNEYYLACGDDVIAGILNNSDKFVIIYNAGKAIGKKLKDYTEHPVKVDAPLKINIGGKP